MQLTYKPVNRFVQFELYHSYSTPFCSCVNSSAIIPNGNNILLLFMIRREKVKYTISYCIRRDFFNVKLPKYLDPDSSTSDICSSCTISFEFPETFLVIVCSFLPSKYRAIISLLSSASLLLEENDDVFGDFF